MDRTSTSVAPNGARIYHFHYKPAHPNSDDLLDRIHPIRTWNIVVRTLTQMDVKTPTKVTKKLEMDYGSTSATYLGTFGGIQRH
jgi:hypothetical protein